MTVDAPFMGKTPTIEKLLRKKKGIIDPARVP
jgi:hypothetical protein